MRACPSCGDENTDRAKFCQNCASPLAAPDEPSAEVRKVTSEGFPVLGLIDTDRSFMDVYGVWQQISDYLQ